MAAVDFNAGAQGEQALPNFLGMSQGTGPNRAFEALFEGVGKVASEWIDRKDTDIRMDIDKTARGVQEGVNQEFGVLPPKLPAGVDTDAAKIRSLHAAMAQGKISQTNYYGRLATLSKQMRAKYPGYEDVVDETIQSVTGTRPANAYRDALFNEVEAENQAAVDEVKARRRWEETNQEYIAAVVGPDYFKDPDKYDLEKVKSAVADFQGRKVLIDNEIRQLDLLSKTEAVNSTRAELVATKDFNLIVESGLNQMIGSTGKSFNETLNGFVAGGMKPAQMDQFIQSLTSSENTMRVALLAKARKDYSNVLDGKKQEALVDAAMAPIRLAKEALLGGDFKAAARYATINKAISDQALNEMFKADPRFTAAAGLAEVNKNVSEQLLNAPDKDGEKDVNTIALEVAGRVMLGDTKTVEAIFDSGNGKVGRALINKLPRALAEFENAEGGKAFSNMINTMFGPSGPDIMSKVSKDDSATFYNTWLDPRVTKAIKEKGTKQDMETYLNWALEKFGTVHEFRAAAGDMGASKTVTGMQVQFDQKTRRFSINWDYKKQAEDLLNPLVGPYNIRNAYVENQKNAAINTLNNALGSLEPVIEAAGEDPNAMIQKLIGDLKIKLDDNMPDSFWGKVLGAVQEVDLGLVNVAGASELSNKDINFMNEKPQVNPVDSWSEEDLAALDDPDTNNILDMLGKSEGAGYGTLFGNTQGRYGANLTEMKISEVFDLQNKMAKDLGTSAVGKYQVIRGTLRNAVKALGISPDEKFSKETQDRVALYLLENRGYSKWKSGKMNSNEFLNNLAQEWASVPTTGGRSYYAGDKMGNASTKRGKELARHILG